MRPFYVRMPGFSMTRPGRPLRTGDLQLINASVCLPVWSSHVLIMEIEGPMSGSAQTIIGRPNYIGCSLGFTKKGVTVYSYTHYYSNQPTEKGHRMPWAIGLV